MSIYATLWHLQFPRHGDAYVGCEWVDVFAQRTFVDGSWWMVGRAAARKR